MWDTAAQDCLLLEEEDGSRRPCVAIVLSNTKIDIHVNLLCSVTCVFTLENGRAPSTKVRPASTSGSNEFCTQAMLVRADTVRE